MSITAYFTGLDKFQISLDDRGFSTSIKEMMMEAGAQMNHQQAVLYYHAAAGFPPKETFLDAVRTGNYSSWLGLTT
jgi:hypothetical protein